MAQNPEFEAELRAEGLHADLIAFIMTQCGTPERFANYFDSNSDVLEHIVNRVPATEDDRNAQAAVVSLGRKVRSPGEQVSPPPGG